MKFKSENQSPRRRSLLFASGRVRVPPGASIGPGLRSGARSRQTAQAYWRRCSARRTVGSLSVQSGGTEDIKEGKWYPLTLNGWVRYLFLFLDYLSDEGGQLPSQGDSPCTKRSRIPLAPPGRGPGPRHGREEVRIPPRRPVRPPALRPGQEGRGQRGGQRPELDEGGPTPRRGPARTLRQDHLEAPGIPRPGERPLPQVGEDSRPGDGTRPPRHAGRRRSQGGATARRPGPLLPHAGDRPLLHVHSGRRAQGPRDRRSSR